MVLLVILAVLFIAIAIMVVVGEKHGKPLAPEQQQKYSKILVVLVFVLLIGGMIRLML